MPGQAWVELLQGRAVLYRESFLDRHILRIFLSSNFKKVQKGSAFLTNFLFNLTNQTEPEQLKQPRLKNLNNNNFSKMCALHFKILNVKKLDSMQPSGAS